MQAESRITGKLKQWEMKSTVKKIDEYHLNHAQTESKYTTKVT